MAHRVQQWIVGLGCAVVLVGVAAPAAAQGPAADVAIGYQFMRDSELDENFPAGWFVSVGANLTDSLAIVGEVAGSQSSAGSALASLDVDVYTYMGGIRLHRRMAGFTPFAQVLVGAARGVASVNILGITVDESATSAAVQPGAGVDLQLSDAFGLRFAGDYRRILGDGGNEVRFLAGVVVGFGNR